MLTVKLNHAGAFQWIVASATIKKLVLIIGAVSYTHLDVYKRQILLVSTPHSLDLLFIIA